MSHLSKPGKMLSPTEVIRLLLIGVCLPLKANVPVGPKVGAIYKELYKVLNYIPYIIRYKEHLLHLLGMDTLMIKSNIVYHCPLSAEKYAKEIDCLVSLKRNYVICHYPHYPILLFPHIYWTLL